MSERSRVPKMRCFQWLVDSARAKDDDERKSDASRFVQLVRRIYAHLFAAMDLSGEGSGGGQAKLDSEDDPAEDEDDEPESEETRSPSFPMTLVLTHPQDMESDELSPPPSPHKPRLKTELELSQILSPNALSS